MVVTTKCLVGNGHHGEILHCIAYTFRIHGVCVCDSADYFYQHVDDQLKLFGLTTNREGNPLHARDIVDVIEGYKGRGYGLNTEEELGKMRLVRYRGEEGRGLNLRKIHMVLTGTTCIICIPRRDAEI